MSVRAKLLGVVGILSAVAVILAVIGWHQMSEIDNRLVYVVEHPAKAENHAAHAAIALTQIQREEKDIILAETDSERAKHAEAIRQIESKMMVHLDDLEKVCDPESVPLVKAFREDYAAYKSVTERTISLAAEDSDGQAARLSATESESLYRTISQPLNDLSERCEHRVNELMADVSERTDEVGREKLAEAANASLAAQRAALLVQDLVQLLRSEKDFVLARTPEDMDRAENSIKETLARVQRAKIQLEPLIGDTDREMLAAAAADLTKWAELDDQIRALARKRTRAEAALLSAGEGESLYEKAEHEMEALIVRAEERMHAEEVAAKHAFESGVRELVIAAVCGTLAGLAASMFIVHRMLTTLNAVVTRMCKVADGDLIGDPIPVASRDELGLLASTTNRMQDGLREMVGRISSTSGQVAAAATEVAASSEEMARSSELQRTQLIQVAAAVEEMAATVNEVAGRAGEVARQSEDAGRQAEDGGQIVHRTVDEMGRIATQVESTAGAVSQLSERAEQIGSILTVINDIADQTNLLALNAAIEAARAGEHGRGFAVVADEVRKLAERTQEATKQVTTSISEIRQATNQASSLMSVSKDQVLSGVDLVHQTGRTLEGIVDGSTTVARSIESIAAAVEQQSAASTEIAQSVEVISAAADEATQGANQAAAAATQLSGNAEELQELIGRFRV